MGETTEINILDLGEMTNLRCVQRGELIDMALVPFEGKTLIVGSAHPAELKALLDHGIPMHASINGERRGMRLFKHDDVITVNNEHEPLATYDTAAVRAALFTN